MTKRFKILTFVVLIVLAVSCVEEYWPEINKYERLLVVDGFLTNSDDSTIVRLSYSSSLEGEAPESVTGASVYIDDSNGNIVDLVEIKPGKYIVESDIFKGKVGVSYKLIIALENGSVYESGYCELLPPAAIDSVYAIVEYKDVSGLTHRMEGLQFYIDNHSYADDTCNYLWRLTQTYKYNSSFTLDYMFAGQYIAVNNPDSLMTCWRTKQVDDIFTYSTAFLNEPVLNKYPLVYTSSETKLLSVRYSLLTEQLRISREDYLFWDAVKQQAGSFETLYAQQPVQVSGNMRNIDDDSEVVLGNFTVGGSTMKRIYVDRPPLTFYYSICDPDFESMMMVGASPPSRWPIFITEIPGMGMALGASDVCFDCRLEGGLLTKPEFWED